MYNLLLLAAALLLFVWSTAANSHNAHLLLWLAFTAKCQPTQNTFKHKLRIDSLWHHHPDCYASCRLIFLPCVCFASIYASTAAKSYILNWVWTAANFIIEVRRQRRSQEGCWRGSSTPLRDQNIYGYFLVFTNIVLKSRSGALQNVLWQYHRRSNTFVIEPSGYEFSRFEKYWSSFLHSCVFCATIYNKSWVLSCSASVETSMTFELPTVSIDV